MSEYVTDKDIDDVWGNANFGDMPRRNVVNQALFQIAGGYSIGHTAMRICQELGLVGIKRGHYQNLTKKGKRYLYEVYKGLRGQTMTKPTNEEMPETIYALKSNMDSEYTGTYCDTNDGGQKYIRADLVESHVKISPSNWEELMQEATSEKKEKSRIVVNPDGTRELMLSDEGRKELIQTYIDIEKSFKKPKSEDVAEALDYINDYLDPYDNLVDSLDEVDRRYFISLYKHHLTIRNLLWAYQGD